MGKLITLISMLIIIDLLFLATGQLTLDSPSSAILNGIQDPSILKDSNIWTILIAGIGVLAVVSAVIAGIATRNSDIVIFVSMGTALSVLVGDYITIYNHLASINKPLAVLIMSPIIMIFTLTIVEWVRGKD